MELKNQVVSLELSKTLKKLWFEQESIFDWVEIDDNDWMLMIRKKKEFAMIDDDTKDSIVSAYTVAELGEMLPSNLSSFDVGEPSEYGSTWLTIEKDEMSTIWFVSYENSNHQMFIPQFKEDTMANAMAKMLIYLKENNLI